MSRRFPDLRDHPVLAIMVGFVVLALVAVPSLLIFAGGGEPTNPGASDRTASSPPSSSQQGDGQGGDGAPQDLTVADAVPVARAAADVVSQDDVFPDYRAELLTMGPLASDAAEAEDVDDGWVEVYALRPADAAPREQGGPLVQERVGLLNRSSSGDVSTLQVIEEEPDRAAPQQVVSASYEDGALVWQETPSTDAAAQPFAIYTWSLDEGEVREIARSTQVQGEDPPPVPGFSGPVLTGDTVLWTQVADTPGQRADVLGCRLPDCTPEVVQRDAAYPTRGPEGMALLARGSEEGLVSLVEVAEDLTTSPGVQLPADVATVTGFAGSGSGYVLLETPGQESTRAILLETADDDAPQVVVGPPAGGFVYAVSGDRLAAWGFAGAGDEPVGGYAFDRAEGRLLSLGDSSARYGVSVASGRVAFQVDSDRPDGLPGQRVALLR